MSSTTTIRLSGTLSEYVSANVGEAGSFRIDEVYQYTRDWWGAAQADTYITGLFAAFEKIATHEV